VFPELGQLIGKLRRYIFDPAGKLASVDGDDAKRWLPLFVNKCSEVSIFGHDDASI
jgi:hypothetical protein